MSELLDKQVNAQKESLIKNLPGFTKLLQAHEKVCDENEKKRWEPYKIWKKGVSKTVAETRVMDIKWL